MVAPSPKLIPTALTSLATVKNWIWGAASTPAQPATADNMLIDLINKASRGVSSYLLRPNMLMRTITETRNGTGNATMLLAEWPVIGDLSSLTIDGAVTSKRPNVGANGWVLTNPWDGYGPGGVQTVALTNGQVFTKDYGNVGFTYTAGYGIIGESQSIAGDGTVYPLAPLGIFAQDTKVTYANGTVLVPVAASPAAGHYIPPSGTGQPYQFNTSEANTVVLLTYSYVPFDLEQATVKWMGEGFKYRDRIGLKSTSLAGQQTSSYDLSAMPADVKLMLQNFNRVVNV